MRARAGRFLLAYPSVISSRHRSAFACVRNSYPIWRERKRPLSAYQHHSASYEIQQNTVAKYSDHIQGQRIEIQLSKDCSSKNSRPVALGYFVVARKTYTEPVF